MTERIFKSIFFVAVMVFAASLMLILGFLYGYFTDVQRTQLQMQTELAAHGVNLEGEAYFEGLEADDYRVTWIAEDGTVLYDNYGDEESMENHLWREEVREAVKFGYGESERKSATLEERFLYAAQKLDDDSIIRLSIGQSSILTLILGMLQPICTIFTIALVLSLILAYRLAKNIVEPLNKLNLDEPLKNENYDELSPLLRRIAWQQKELSKKSSELRNRQNEFETVTNSMTEGLVLLNSKGTILSINESAENLLDTDHESVGKNILTINRSIEVQDVFAKALAGENTRKVAKINEGFYQIEASPVVVGGNISGIALLMFDVTERENAEQMRREFTANVSHELKTPLHTISGYAELMKVGIIKEDDVQPCATKIYAEAQRLAQLVEDILNLSHLDEGAEGMKKMEVDLYDLCGATIRNLEPEADSAGVKLLLEGESAIINGIPQLVGSIVFNLCDNAIKYNREGGKVKVTVTDGADETTVKVEDTGIGIPAEHLGRIFERFYRVDKSHSKEVGGTGLGLSIVKHAVKIHDAKVEVDSVVGEGTTITVAFPK
ncbi:MAG: PAS domain-containing sensor histidine kinase [Firmicutes bacterium]|nr:PAS domain-containing sensor histidine kinase [Bacillota bacterium]